MADVCDKSDNEVFAMAQNGVRAIQKAASAVEPGTPGECDECGYHFQRVVPRYTVDGRRLLCGGCRDELGIK